VVVNGSTVTVTPATFNAVEGQPVSNVVVATFTDMTAVYILTNGGPDNATQVLPSWAFTKGIQGGDLSGGAATALFMFPVLLALSILMLRRASRAEVS
jgi:multiple sugar transport system permease protein